MVGSRARRWRLGAFLLGAGLLFLALLTFVLDSTIRQNRATYFILFEENVKGMVVGSKVNFQGVPVGVVCDMRFQDGKTRVELSVDPSRATIQEVTKARMDRLLVTGQVTIELEGFERTARALPEGALIATREDPLNSLRGSVPEVVDEATAVLHRLDTLLQRGEVLLGDDNQKRVAALLDELAATVRDVRQRTLPAMDALVAELHGFVADGRLAVADARAAVGDVRTASASLQAIEPKVAALAARADAMLLELAGLVTGLRAPVQSALASMRQTLDDARALARQLRLAPDSLLFGVQRPASPAGGQR